MKQVSLVILASVVVVITTACSNSNAPGTWVVQDTQTGDSFYSANFVNDKVGWLNAMSGRNEVPDESDSANKNAKPNRNATK